MSRDWLVVNYRDENGRSPSWWCRKCGGGGQLDLVDKQYWFLYKSLDCPSCYGSGLEENDPPLPGLEHIDPGPKYGEMIRGFADHRLSRRVYCDSVAGEFDAKDTQVEVHGDRPAVE